MVTNNAENDVPEPSWIGARVVDPRGIAYTRFSDSEAYNAGDWINEDGLIVQWSEITRPRRVLPPGTGAGE